MLFGLNVLPLAPILQKCKGSKVVESAIRQQSEAIAQFNNMLNFSRPDKFKVSWDKRQAEIAAGANPASLPPLKQL